MTSRLGSKDNIKHVPGGGNVSNVTACGVAVVQTNTVTVPHDALRPNNEALSLLMNKKERGETLPNPMLLSCIFQSKSWWQQRFGFIILSHTNLFSSPCVQALHETLILAVTLRFEQLHQMIVCFHRSRFSPRRLTWVKWPQSVAPRSTSNINQVWWAQKWTVEP